MPRRLYFEILNEIFFFYRFFQIAQTNLLRLMNLHIRKPLKMLTLKKTMMMDVRVHLMIMVSFLMLTSLCTQEQRSP